VPYWLATFASLNRMNPPIRMIIELNIRHYRDLLKTTTDVSKRQTIARLLGEEKAKLLKLSAAANKEHDRGDSSA
jgi:hypothetical protein